MAQALPCDYCGNENAVLMMTNLDDGGTVTVGAACLPLFFGGALLGSIGSDGHAGPPTKCQACRRTHERMTTPVAPISIPDSDTAAAEPDRREAEHHDTSPAAARTAYEIATGSTPDAASGGA